MRTKPDLVKRGDAETIEFKSQIPQKQEAIAIAAVAFANRKGGRIFVRVEAMHRSSVAKVKI